MLLFPMVGKGLIRVLTPIMVCVCDALCYVEVSYSS